MKSNRLSKKNTKQKRNNQFLTMSKQIRDTDVLEVGYYHNLIDYQNDARDLFTYINSASNDYSQYRDIYANFKMLSVTFNIVPAYIYTASQSDNAVGLFAQRQGVYEASPVSQSVSTVVQYPGTKGIHNYKNSTHTFTINNGDWYSNAETNSAVSRIAKLTYYVAWYKVATTNTAQGIVQVRVRLAAKCKLI